MTALDATRKHARNSLVVTPWSPYPLIFGGAIRIFYIIKMLAEFSNVTLITYKSYFGDDDPEPFLRTICSDVVIVDAKPIADAKLRIRSTFSKRSFQYLSHYSPEMQQAIDRVVASQQFDEVIYELSQMGVFDYSKANAPVVLDMANIEHELIERRADVTSSPWKRWALHREAHKFKVEEMAICDAANLILVTSERERLIVRDIPGMPPVATVANTVDPEFFDGSAARPVDNEIVFIGTTHVDANRDGVRWFANEILPLVEREIPGVRFKVVGGTPPDDILALASAPNIDVLGFVPDVRDHMATATALVVPLRSGGGTRLKIIEALSYGLPTVSTSLGAEGLDINHDHDILIADNPADFAAEVVRVLRDPALRARLIDNGRRLAHDEYSWRSVIPALRTALESIPPR